MWRLSQCCPFGLWVVQLIKIYGRFHTKTMPAVVNFQLRCFCRYISNCRRLYIIRLLLFYLKKKFNHFILIRFQIRNIIVRHASSTTIATNKLIVIQCKIGQHTALRRVNKPNWTNRACRHFILATEAVRRNELSNTIENDEQKCGDDVFIMAAVDGIMPWYAVDSRDGWIGE